MRPGGPSTAIGVGLGLVLAGWPLATLGQTAITPDVGAARGLGTTVTASGATYAIDGGTRAGGNLFHSFQRFSLGVGDTAAWTRSAGDAAAIRHVINRVTGGEVSQIAGTLDSTALPNASFYFINPAGIVFGAGARVNVPSAAYFSTAADLRLADGTKFAVATPTGSTLSLAAPESFGFVGGQGAIDIQSVGSEFVPGSTALSFTASDIHVANARFATGGLDMVAVGDGAASVRLADPLAGTYTGDLRIGASTLNAAAIDAPGGPFRLGGGLIDLDATGIVTDTAGTAAGADLILKANRIQLAPDSFVISSSRGSGAGGQVLITARELDADATGGTTTTGFTSVAVAGGAAGAIRVTADNLRLAGGAFVGSTVSGDGDAGDVSLSATSLVIDNAVISSATFGNGDGGEIHIRADTLDFGAATIVTAGFGLGAAGDVFVDGRTLDISGGFIGSTPGGVGDSGDVFITLTGRLYALGGNLGASSFSANNAGVITVRAPEVVMEQSTIATSATAAGSPGRVLIETGRLVFDRVNMLGSSKDGGGDGVIQLRSTGDLLMRGAIIFSNALGLANGGVVMIEGKSVEMINTLINSDTFAFGAAGRIELRADTLHLENTQITSTTDGEGVGGAVSVFGRAITLDTSSALRSDTTRLAKAGSVAVTATERLDLLDLAAVTSQAASGTGDGGSVSITAGRLFMADATVSSDSLSLGRAGTVAVKADQIELDGRNREFTGISSDSFGFGDAGSVTIDARSLTVRDKAYVSSTGIRDGRAGDITIRTGDLSVSRGGTISSLGVQTDGGDISIVATGNLTVTSEPGFGSFIASAASGGDAGDLSLDVGGTLLLDASALSSDTFGPGDAGDLMIKAAAITLKSMSAISSSTGSFGNAGALTIEAKTITMDAGTQILSAATSMSEGDARSITIRADTIAVGKDATITTATFGRGDAGKVDITARSLRIDGGEVSSSAGVGSQGVAGDVRIAAGDLSIVNGGILSTLSANSNTAGELRISADQVSLDGLRSIISSENLADDRGDAGEIFITAKGVRVANGAGISTNSVAGAAGNIDIRVARPGLLVLEGGELPGLILTSSGPGTGGMITIADPLAIISNGGRILALGEQRGANVQISSRFFINSSDRSNVVDVAGDFRLQTGLYDVSSGTVSRDLSVLDASKVLQGQCPVARSTGLVSQLITRPVGPYVRDTGLEAAPARAGATNPGACP